MFELFGNCKYKIVLRQMVEIFKLKYYGDMELFNIL